MIKIASFNVENMFDRAKVLNRNNPEPAGPILQAYSRLSELFELAEYTPGVKAEMATLIAKLGLDRSDTGTGGVELRKVRGKLLTRPTAGPVQVLADGRDDWVGWLEMKTEPVDEFATQHAAQVIRDVNADIVAVVEVENRVVLKRFEQTVLQQAGGPHYAHLMVIDGNDDRGIDVGILSKPGFVLGNMRSHVDLGGADPVFGRDCPEYEIRTAAGTVITVLVNHFKSKGYGKPAVNNAKRARQATAVADIYRRLSAEKKRNVVVVGDLNDTPDSAPLRALLVQTDLIDISAHPGFDDGGFPGTYGTGSKSGKIDYILLSPALNRKVLAGGIFRAGVWTASDRWKMYPTLTGPVRAASDHAAIWAELDLD